MEIRFFGVPVLLTQLPCCNASCGNSLGIVKQPDIPPSAEATEHECQGIMLKMLPVAASSLKTEEGHIMRHNFVTLLALLLLSASSYSHAVKLITDEEARLPDSDGTGTRAITRGPEVKLVSPDPSAGPIKGPFAFKVAFQPRSGAKVDAASVKLTYLKATPVDLTERIKSSVTESGIEVSGAVIPPGKHEIRIFVKDAEGRKTTKIIGLTAIK